MPKGLPKISIRLDLLKPQSNPEKIPIKLIRWLFSTGRYIFIFVEALVLLAFILRFKLDADLAAKKEAIDRLVPYIESLKSYEVLIKQTQLKLAAIASFSKGSIDYPQTLKKIADNTPIGVRVNNLSLEKNLDKTSIRITAQTQNSNDVITYLISLREDQSFSNVNLTSMGLEQGIIKFSIELDSKILSEGNP